MCSIDWNLILGFYKETSLFQLFVAVFLIVFLYKYRAEISNQIKNGKWNINVGGVAIAGAGLQQNSIGDKNGQSPYEDSEIERLKQVETAAKELLTNHNNLWVKYQWEKATNQIFGTQIRLLKYLLTKDHKGVLITELSSFYEEHVKQLTPETTTVDNYLGYLKYYLFIEKIEEENSFLPTIKITQMGKDYLSYLDTQYLSIENRRLF